MNPGELADRLREGGYHDQARNLRRAVETMGLPLRRPGSPPLVVHMGDGGLVARLAEGGALIADEHQCHTPRNQAVGDVQGMLSGKKKKITLWMPEELWEALGKAGPNRSHEVVQAVVAHLKAKGL